MCGHQCRVLGDGYRYVWEYDWTPHASFKILPAATTTALVRIVQSIGVWSIGDLHGDGKSTIAPGIGTPTGTVTFYDGTTALGHRIAGQ